MSKQIQLFNEDEGTLQPNEFKPGLTIDERIEKYGTHFEGNIGCCRCEGHKHRPGEDCIHIKELRLRNTSKILETVCDHIIDKRDIRDKDNPGLEGAINKIGAHRTGELVDLMHIVVNLAVKNGTVCSDDLHTVTNEQYHDDMIIGTVFAVLLRTKTIEEVGRQPTKRKCAHGRKINVYRLIEKKEPGMCKPGRDAL